MNIRPETPEDLEAIRRVSTRAFGRPAEAKLIESLRASNQVISSLVALRDGQIIGHILFFPLIIGGPNGRHIAVGLGPMAVTPQCQREGVGSALVHAGLEELRKGEHGAVIVLGHPPFYARAGFVPASTYGVKTHYDVPDEVFMALELREGWLKGKEGTVIYAAEFDSV